MGYEPYKTIVIRLFNATPPDISSYYLNGNAMSDNKWIPLH